MPPTRAIIAIVLLTVLGKMPSAVAQQANAIKASHSAVVVQPNNEKRTQNVREIPALTSSIPLKVKVFGRRTVSPRQASLVEQSSVRTLSAVKRRVRRRRRNIARKKADRSWTRKVLLND